MARNQPVIRDQSSDDEMVMEIVSKKENKNPLSKDTANVNNTKGNSKKKPAASKKPTTAKSKPAAVVSSSDDASSEDQEPEAMEEVQEEQTESSSESQEAIVVAPSKKVTKKEAAAAKAAPVKAKKAKVVEKEEYEIVEVVAKVSAKEKRLQAKLDAMTKAFEEVTTSFENLRGLRYTRAEESEKALTELASARTTASLNTLAKYKQDNESLRNELTTLLSSSPTLSSSLLLSEELASLHTTTDLLRNDNVRLEEHIKELRVQLVDAEKMRRDAEKRERKREEEEREKIIKERVSDVNSALKATQKDLDQAKAELAAEISHSKSLQTKLATSASTSTTTSHVGGSGDRLREENDSLKARLGLNEDMTGLQVTSMAEQAEGTVFSCILSDFLCKNGTLDFKVQFPPDGTFCYTPNLEPERDSVMINLLPEEYRSFMRFDAYEAGRWFKKLLYSINKM